MKRVCRLREWAMVVVTLSILGCGMKHTEEGLPIAAPEPGEMSSIDALPPAVTGEGEGRDVSQLNLGPSWTQYTMPARGGFGGAFSGHVPGGIIYGVQINAGRYIDHIRFAWYRPSQPDNLYRVGDTYGSTGNYGGTGGTAHPWFYCPNGQGIIGYSGSHHPSKFLYSVRFLCGNVTAPDTLSPANRWSPYYGTLTGTFFRDVCAPNHLLTAYNIRWGLYVDQLQGICIRAR